MHAAYCHHHTLQNSSKDKCLNGWTWSCLFDPDLYISSRSCRPVQPCLLASVTSMTPSSSLAEMVPELIHPSCFPGELGSLLAADLADLSSLDNPQPHGCSQSQQQQQLRVPSTVRRPAGHANSNDIRLRLLASLPARQLECWP